MKEFNTAIREVEEDEETPVEFAIDGMQLRAYRPTDGQIAMTMAAMGRYTSESTKVAGVIDFFVQVLDEESHQYVVERLLSRTDPLGLPQVEEILEWLVEEWTGRPTQALSVSTQSRVSAGPRSKPTTRKSTSSASARGSS